MPYEYYEAALGENVVSPQLLQALKEKNLEILKDKDGKYNIEVRKNRLPSNDIHISALLTSTDKTSPLFGQRFEVKLGHNAETGHTFIYDTTLGTHKYGSDGQKIELMPLHTSNNEDPPQVGLLFRDDDKAEKIKLTRIFERSFADTAAYVEKGIANTLKKQPITFVSHSFGGGVDVQFRDYKNPSKMQSITLDTVSEQERLRVTGIRLTSHKDGKTITQRVPLPEGYYFQQNEHRFLDHEASLPTAKTIAEYVKFKQNGDQFEMEYTGKRALFNEVGAQKHKGVNDNQDTLQYYLQPMISNTAEPRQELKRVSHTIAEHMAAENDNQDNKNKADVFMIAGDPAKFLTEGVTILLAKQSHENNKFVTKALHFKPDGTLDKTQDINMPLDGSNQQREKLEAKLKSERLVSLNEHKSSAMEIALHSYKKSPNQPMVAKSDNSHLPIIKGPNTIQMS